MNVKHLKHLKKLCGRNLQKDFEFSMAIWQRETKPGLGVNCKTAGCLAALIGTDSYFTDLGYSMERHKPDDRFQDEEIFFKPIFKGCERYDALGKLFCINQERVNYIFGGHNSDYLCDAIERIENIISGRWVPDTYEEEA